MCPATAAGRKAFWSSLPDRRAVAAEPRYARLRCRPGKNISSITFLDKEQHGLVIGEKSVTFDMLCKDAVSGEKFIFSMKYMHLKRSRPECFTEPLLDDLYTATRLASMTVIERENYEKSMRTEIDRIAEKAYAVEQSYNQARTDVAKALLAEGIQPSVISKCTGLSLEELSALSN